MLSLLVADRDILPGGARRVNDAKVSLLTEPAPAAS
jgi:hypothetical protein